MTVHSTGVGVFTATRWELDAVRRAFRVEREEPVGGVRCVVGEGKFGRVSLFQTGIGFARAERVVRAALDHGTFHLLISTGFACALGGAAIGDLLIGTSVERRDGGGEDIRGLSNWTCEPNYAALASRVAQSIGIHNEVGPFVTVPRVLWRASEKRAMAESSRAIGADMESAAICMVGQERQIPVMVARTVSDLLDEDLPLDFNAFLEPKGWVRGMFQCVAHPSFLMGLNRMRIQGAKGAERLTGFFRQLFVELA